MLARLPSLAFLVVSLSILSVCVSTRALCLETASRFRFAWRLESGKDGKGGTAGRPTAAFSCLSLRLSQYLISMRQYACVMSRNYIPVLLDLAPGGGKGTAGPSLPPLAFQRLTPSISISISMRQYACVLSQNYIPVSPDLAPPEKAVEEEKGGCWPIAPPLALAVSLSISISMRQYGLRCVSKLHPGFAPPASRQTKNGERPAHLSRLLLTTRIHTPHTGSHAQFPKTPSPPPPFPFPGGRGRGCTAAGQVWRAAAAALACCGGAQASRVGKAAAAGHARPRQRRRRLPGHAPDAQCARRAGCAAAGHAGRRRPQARLWRPRYSCAPQRDVTAGACVRRRRRWL